jgi:hypothetical protein
MSIRIFGPNAAIQTVKLCRNCVYFRPDPKFNKNDSAHIELGLCAISGIQDLVSGKIRSSYASVHRSNIYECGPDGKYFSEAPPQEPELPK